MDCTIYLCSENKGADQLCGYHADQLRSYRAADLPVFKYMQKAGFLMTRLMLCIPNMVILTCALNNCDFMEKYCKLSFNYHIIIFWSTVLSKQSLDKYWDPWACVDAQAD